VDIQVNDESFKRFAAAFADYSAELEKQPESWRRLNAAMEGAGDAGNALASGALTGKEALALAFAQAELIGGALSKAAKAQNALGDASHSTNKKMGELAKTAKSLGGEIAGVGKWVLKLGAGALAGLGLGALLGGFGVGELASAAFSRQRAAGGLGLSPGQLASFGVNAKPFLGEGALQAAAASQLTYQSAPYLSMLGIDFRNAQGMSAADLAFEQLKGAVKAWQSAQKSGTPPASSPFVRAYQELGGNLEDVRRAALAGLPAINAAQGAYKRDVGVLGFDKKTGDAWTQFYVQLDRAGKEIETIFINKLAPLAPEFTKLSAWVTDAIASFVNTIGVGGIKQGLSDFGDFLTKTNWKAVGEDFKLLGSEIAVIAKKFAWLLPQQTGDPSKPYDPLGFPDKLKRDAKWLGDVFGHAKIGLDVSGPLAWAKSLPKKALDALRSPTGIHAFNQMMSAATGIPVQILDRLLLAESGYGRNPGTSSAGALGLAQLMPETAKGLGVTDRTNPAQSIAGGAKYLQQMYAKYHDWGKALAAYNMGPGALDAVLARHAKDWLRYVPSDTRGYVHDIYGSGAASSDAILRRILKVEQARNRVKPVHVNITNSTAARVAVSANALAAG
jgi:hypothetical protein